MPKKTKKEKLLAQLRRTQLPRVQPPSTPTPEASRSGLTYSLPVTRTKNAPKRDAVPMDDFRVMKRDLTKTVILTTVILISEFLLSGLLLKK